MVDVFISYARDNQDVVRKLAEAVKREGYGIWWDDALPPHLAYGDVIAEKVGQAKAAIVVWSAAAAASEWVRAEADMARNQKKLVQTSIDDRMPPMPFNQLHFVSLAGWDGGDDHPGWRKVKESLVALCGPPGGEAAIPPAPAAAPPPAAPAPPPAPAPRPAAPEPAPAPRASGSSNRLLIAAILVSLLVVATVGVLALLRGREAPPVESNRTASPADLAGAAPQPIPVAPPPPPAAEQFAMAATVQDADGYANVRSGPSADAPIVARANAGETVMTYRQEGGWWRVQIAGGLVGYVERSRLRLAVAPPPPPTVVAVPPAAAPPEAAPRPRAQQPPRREPGPRINEANAGVMREYCKGAGAGTPPCRRFEGGRRRRR